MKTENVVFDKSMVFAVRIVKLGKFLMAKHEYVLSKQVLRSGTSVGANIKEGMYAQSKADFISKMSIALKEAAETEYWLDLLYKTDYIAQKEYESIQSDCGELCKLLSIIVKSSKNGEARQ